MKKILLVVLIVFPLLISGCSSDDSSNYSGYRSSSQNSNSERVDNGCCKHCTTGQACGDSCISRSYTCHKAPGCACDY